MKEVLLAETAGFCAGVRRAVDIAEREAEKGPCRTLGVLVHNRAVTGDLAKLGVGVLDEPENARPGERIILRSHGASPAQLRALERAGAEVVSAVCPAVERIHRIVREDDARGMQIVILGQRGHPEVEATRGWCSDARVFQTPEEISEFAAENPDFFQKRLSVVMQTTASPKITGECVKILKNFCTFAKISDTICATTEHRQQEAVRLSDRCQAMVVVGDPHSANSRELAEVCRRSGAAVFFLSDAGQLDLAALRSFSTVGVTAGASVPPRIIKEVYHKMIDEIKAEGIVQDPETETVAAEEPVAAAAEPETFEELLERSIKTLHTGQKVTGTVTRIGATEIEVELGAKQAGFISMDELTDDPSVKPEDIVKIGDTIETYVMRVNDVEGTVSLSKKRVDSSKVWENINEAKENRTVLEGTVTEENKGGVVVNVKGVRVFVPASQSGLPKDAPLTPLVGTKVKLRVIEVNQSRRRVVGSIRQAAGEERRARAEQIWNEIEIGKTYTGVVKSLTSYGAFVDIGGIDGMVHVSELSWSRIKQPSDVLKVGDTVEVHVLGFDKEKKKISLGYRKDEDNPWTKFTNTYQVGDVAEVKIVKLMEFGAFAEVLPGVDGLIHISQIADHRIGKPGEVLSVGQMVNVKIIDIDQEKKKISLSIRALLAPQTMPAASIRAEDEPQGDDEVVYDSDAPVQE